MAKVVITIRRVEPNYGRNLGAKSADSKADHAKSVVEAFPTNIKKILGIINSHLKTTKLSREDLFNTLDKNSNGTVDRSELEVYFASENIVEGLPVHEIHSLFNFLDNNGDGVVSVNEFCLLIEGIELSFQERMLSFSKQFEQTLVAEIGALFDRLDVNRNGNLSAEELVIIFKSTSEKGLSLDRARDVVQQLDRDNTGTISKSEFLTYVLPKQKERLLEMEDEMEDLRAVFKQKVAK